LPQATGLENRVQIVIQKSETESLRVLAEPFLVDSTDFQMLSEILGYVMTTVIDSTEEIESSDDQLMEGVVDRKSEALECIYMRYESLLRAVILGVIRDESEVDDILHDVLLQVWEQGDRYNPNERGLRGLLVTLARRRALDRLRRRAAYRRATEGLKNDVDNPLINEITTTTSHLENSDLSLLLGRLIQLLPEAQKEVIHLTFFNGLSQREIARQRRISLGTVKTRLPLAQRKLHQISSANSEQDMIVLWRNHSCCETQSIAKRTMSSESGNPNFSLI
jgi:RNA polymerase sigma-70 factor, ECF subfamily